MLSNVNVATSGIDEYYNARLSENGLHLWVPAAVIDRARFYVVLIRADLDDTSKFETASISQVFMNAHLGRCHPNTNNFE